MHRADLAATRLTALLGAMLHDPIAPPENVRSLREGLAEHFQAANFLACESMGELVRENLELLRRQIGKDTDPLTTTPLTM